jgi:hypothetical protein
MRGESVNHRGGLGAPGFSFVPFNPWSILERLAVRYRPCWDEGRAWMAGMKTRHGEGMRRTDESDGDAEMSGSNLGSRSDVKLFVGMESRPTFQRAQYPCCLQM